MAEEKHSLTDEIVRLAELKEKGVLTEDEFSTAKAALLRSLQTTHPVGTPRPVDEATARVREQLEQFKNRFAHTAVNKLYSLLDESEDLLIFIWGQKRFVEFRNECYRITVCFDAQDSNSWTNEYKRDRLKEAHEISEKLKRRIAGVEYRSQ